MAVVNADYNMLETFGVKNYSCFELIKLLMKHNSYIPFDQILKWFFNFLYMQNLFYI
jgi:hypothetical protein